MNRKILISLTLLFTMALSSCYKNVKVDLLVHNAKIYTVDNTFSITDAMAIKNGKIIALGPENEIMNKYYADETIDAKTRPVFPGFIDAHCHFLAYGLNLENINLTGTASFEEVLNRVKNKGEANQSGWILGRGWDHNSWAVKEFPDKDSLDLLFPNTPVFLRRIDGHAALANQQALDQAGITTETKVDGGVIEVKNGKLTGILIDKAVELVSKVIPQPGVEDKKNALLKAQENCFEKGITTVDDAGLEKEEVELIDQLQKEDELLMKVYAMLSPSNENFERYLPNGPYITDKLSVRSFKFYADGALGSRGALLINPYSDDPGNTGLLQNSAEYFRKNAQKVLSSGFQMNTHCIGDSANRMILNIYGELLKGVNDKRWRIEHAQVVHPEDFKLFKENTVIPSVQPTHATSDMDWADERLGKERLKSAYAYKKLLEQNGIIALGTDFPIEDIDPMKTFYAAVVRKDGQGNPASGFQMDNSLSREEALKGMTIWAAVSNFEEENKGSLEIGKSADFIILDRDIMVVPEKDLLNTKVLYTIIDGKKVYSYK